MQSTTIEKVVIYSWENFFTESRLLSNVHALCIPFSLAMGILRQREKE